MPPRAEIIRQAVFISAPQEKSEGRHLVRSCRNGHIPSPVERRELLPFRVRLAESPQDIDGAVEIRAAAYARHIPALGQALRKPEADDLRPDALLLIAESKLDGVVVGSLRLQHNFDRPLRIEGELTLPKPTKATAGRGEAA